MERRPEKGDRRPEKGLMKDKFFIDTNIFVYSFDQSAGTKQKI